ncbi:HAD family hydrolase [Pseudaestuariivita rosea]|uniref:HAD family hydrolase n=1 Tax=Pseudaestuariivita rosea TaxID=2763263 RepID=UPI001ABA19AB|nr:HAD family phosphatase [Pseudaestuariivita rosea]
MTVEAVIFDIGNVLIEWQPERFYDGRIGQARRKQMFEAIDLHDMNDQVDRGAPFRDTIYATADHYPEWGDEIRMWYDHWIEMATPRIDHSVRLLRALRARGVPVFALTNFGIESFAYAETQYPLLIEFDRRYISGHMKTVKPEPQIYQMVEQDCGLSPDRLLFTDDRLENIQMAEARGWQVHHFQGSQGWADRLQQAGLLTESEAA